MPTTQEVIDNYKEFKIKLDKPTLAQHLKDLDDLIKEKTQARALPAPVVLNTTLTSVPVHNFIVETKVNLKKHKKYL